VLPDIPWVPTGGIHEDEVGAYLDHRAVAVGLGSTLTGAALAGNPDALAALPSRVSAIAQRWAES
jgi:2-keto-3-deoxy-6-phosphogluconate aldolase